MGNGGDRLAFGPAVGAPGSWFLRGPAINSSPTRSTNFPLCEKYPMLRPVGAPHKRHALDQIGFFPPQPSPLAGPFLTLVPTANGPSHRNRQSFFKYPTAANRYFESTSLLTERQAKADRITAVPSDYRPAAVSCQIPATSRSRLF